MNVRPTNSRQGRKTGGFLLTFAPHCVAINSRFSGSKRTVVVHSLPMMYSIAIWVTGVVSPANHFYCSHPTWRTLCFYHRGCGYAGPNSQPVAGSTGFYSEDGQETKTHRGYYKEGRPVCKQERFREKEHEAYATGAAESKDALNNWSGHMGIPKRTAASRGKRRNARREKTGWQGVMADKTRGRRRGRTSRGGRRGGGGVAIEEGQQQGYKRDELNTACANVDNGNKDSKRTTMAVKLGVVEGWRKPAMVAPLAGSCMRHISTEARGRCIRASGSRWQGRRRSFI